MSKDSIQNLVNFGTYDIRAVFDSKKKVTYYSVVDFVQALIDEPDHQVARRYWSDTKRRLIKEGFQSYEKFVQLKLKSSDGKKYLTDVVDEEHLLRIVQSISSKKVEPIKLWLAKVGRERLEEDLNPEKSVQRGIKRWKHFGHTDQWIEQRLRGISNRNALTASWKKHKVNNKLHYAILSNKIHHGWSDLHVKEHKSFKGLESSHNLRDNMTEGELLIASVGEFAAREMINAIKPEKLSEHLEICKAAAGIAKSTRVDIEEKTGKKVVSSKNFLNISKKIK